MYPFSSSTLKVEAGDLYKFGASLIYSEFQDNKGYLVSSLLQNNNNNNKTKMNGKQGTTSFLFQVKQ